MHLHSVPKLPRLLFPFIILVLAFVTLLPTNSKAQAKNSGDLSADKSVQVAVQQSPTGTPMPITPVPPGAVPPNYAGLVTKAQQQGLVRVIVALNTKFQPEVN